MDRDGKLSNFNLILRPCRVKITLSIDKCCYSNDASSIPASSIFWLTAVTVIFHPHVRTEKENMVELLFSVCIPIPIPSPVGQDMMTYIG